MIVEKLTRDDEIESTNKWWDGLRLKYPGLPKIDWDPFDAGMSQLERDIIERNAVPLLLPHPRPTLPEEYKDTTPYSTPIPYVGPKSDT